MRKTDPPRETREDDAHAFRAAMKGVKPLRAAPRVSAPAARVRHRRPASADARTASGPPPVQRETDAEEMLQFRRPGVQDQLLRKLRRGLIPQAAEIDLHGMTLQQAWDTLADFIEQGRARAQRCVRIVHGKGYRSGGRGPVLKSAVNDWLRHNHDVIAFVSARPLDGGAGALYVLLRA
ncbi:MAG: Smr/MutS family protein [Steroidobacteraceae bacterium]